MSMTVAQYAEIQGISEQRVRELARTGKLLAERVGRAWIIQVPETVERPSRRPLSPQSLTDLLAVIAEMNLDSVQGVRKQRAAERLNKLRAADRPSALLAEWAGRDPAMPNRPHQRAILEAAQRGLDDYLQLVLLEIEGDDFSDPAVLRKRLRDAMQVRKLHVDDLGQRAEVPVDDVRELLKHGRLRNFGRSTRILRAAGLRPGTVPR